MFLRIICVLALLAASAPGFAYSLLTHEQIIDLTWDDSIVPLLLSRYPGLTQAQLDEARAYAYGGCVIQDIGYYPFGQASLSNLTHYVRSGDFVMALFRNATSPNIMLLNDAGQAKIVYSPQFFATAYDRYGDLGILALIAHELGHALDATLGAKWVNEKWTPELRGDAWAGCILAHVDPGVGGYTPSLEALASYPSSAHPDWSQRLPVVRAGFAGCGGDAAKLQKK